MACLSKGEPAWIHDFFLNFLPSQSSCSTSTAVPTEEGIGNQKSTASSLWCWCLLTMKCKCKYVVFCCMMEKQFNELNKMSLAFLIIAFSVWLSLETTGHPSSRSKFSDSWALGHYVRWTRLGHYVGIEVWINKRPIKNTTVGPFFTGLTRGFLLWDSRSWIKSYLVQVRCCGHAPDTYPFFEVCQVWILRWKIGKMIFSYGQYFNSNSLVCHSWLILICSHAFMIALVIGPHNKAKDISAKNWRRRDIFWAPSKFCKGPTMPWRRWCVTWQAYVVFCSVCQKIYKWFNKNQ